MRHFSHMLLTGTIFLLLLAPEVLAGTCTVGLERAMKEEGLSDKQVELICKKAKLYDGQTNQTQERPGVATVKKDLASIFGDRTVNKEPLSSVCKIENVKKTNGMEEGENQYVIEYNGNVSLLRKVYHYGVYGMQFNEMPAFNWSLKAVHPAGTQKAFSGAALYRLTENGWRIERYKIKIDDLVDFSK